MNYDKFLSLLNDKESSGIVLLPSNPYENVMPFKFFNPSSICLGGYPAPALLNAVIIPSWYNHIMMIENDGLNLRLFRDIESAERTSGITLYLCIYVGYGGGSEDITNLKVYFTQPATGVTMSIWAGDIFPAQSVANETTAPSGGSYTSPTSGSPLTLSLLYEPTDDPIPLWIKMVVSPAATAKIFDKFSLTFTSDNFADKTYNFYNTRKSGSSISTIVSSQGNFNSIGVGTTVQYTATTTAEPADQRMFVTISVDSNVFHRIYAGISDSALLWIPSVVGGIGIGLATRTASNVYKFNFGPSIPGYYNIAFNTGEGEPYTIEQWVSSYKL